jgi:ubiquinone biosynthesis protein UbiJ
MYRDGACCVKLLSSMGIGPSPRRPRDAARHGVAAAAEGVHDARVDEERLRALELLAEAILQELRTIREHVERLDERLEEANRRLRDIYGTQVG